MSQSDKTPTGRLPSPPELQGLEGIGRRDGISRLVEVDLAEVERRVMALYSVDRELKRLESTFFPET